MNNLSIEITDWRKNTSGGFAYRYIIMKERDEIKCELRMLVHSMISHKKKTFDNVLQVLVDKKLDLHKRTAIACKSKFFWMDNNIYGISKLSPGDKWDEEKGKKLAYKRAVRKLSLMRLDAVWDALTDLRSLTDNMVQLKDKLNEHIDNVELEIAQLKKF